MPVFVGNLSLSIIASLKTNVAHVTAVVIRLWSHLAGCHIVYCIVSGGSQAI